MPEAASWSIAGVLSHLFVVQLIIPACCWSVMMKRILGLLSPLGLASVDVCPVSITSAAAAAAFTMNSRLFILFSKAFIRFSIRQ
jgi:hypothetical protein